MRSPETWAESKFVYRGGRLAASRDTGQVAVASRLIADLTAGCYEALLRTHARGRLLDLGCGRVPLYRAYRELVDENVCVDWANSLHGNLHLDHEADLTQPLPFGYDEFDTILLSDVLEHVPTPEELWREMARVLKPGGKVIMNVPFFYWLHEQPHDYFRYTEFALRRFAERSALSVVYIAPIGGVPEIMTDLFAKNVVRLRWIGNPLAAASQWLMLQFLRTSFGCRLSRSTARVFPLGYFMIAQKP